MNLESVFKDLIPTQVEKPVSYIFEPYPDLFADKFGNFWMDGKIIEKKYRERQVYIDYKGKRVGIVTLRKLAKKVELDLMPF